MKPRKIPDQLRADYETYFDLVRPLFKGADQCAAIFMSVEGGALSYQGLYRAYTVELQRYANVHMSPQKARHAAANTADKYGLAASKILQQNPTGSPARRAYQHDRPPTTCQRTTAIFKL